MFLLIYLRRELLRRPRQTMVLALGLALGIGLVITVTALSKGVQDAQSKTMQSLYGAGTDITITQAPESGDSNLGAFDELSRAMQSGGPAPGQTIVGDGLVGYGSADQMGGTGLGRLSESSVTQISGLAGVARATGGLTASDIRVELKMPADPTQAAGDGWYNLGGLLARPTAFQVGGVNVADAGLGPLASVGLASGRSFTASDQDAAVAMVDAGYAGTTGLKIGSAVTVGGKKFDVVGVLAQPQGTTPADVYIPLAQAQRLCGIPDDVNTIYVAVDRASDVAAVRDKISRLLPSATVTSSDTVAGAVSGSLATATRLVDDVGRWLAIIVLAAAFALAGLLSLAAVSRRSGEFGLLKALGWHSWRVVGQVIGEAVAQGLVGAVLGIALGTGAAALISRLSPSLTASVGLPGTSSINLYGGPQGALQNAIASSRTVTALDLSAPVTVRAIVLAVVLALAGGLVAGGFGSWRAARLRPAIALRRVE
jgi:ABC-type lipoprotein release transport system permease subunit